MDTAIFISNAISIHGDTYDYQNTEYTTTNKKVVIICRTHGEFTQYPRHHLLGHGCKKCADVRQFLNNEKFITRAINIHGDVYDYSNTEYIGSKDKVIITCKLHGEFLQTPNNHLNGQGCKKCANAALFSNQNDFILSANNVHNFTYDYSNTIYSRSDIKVVINCREHGEFLQTPPNHLSGKGCPKCARFGFNKNKPGILYYLKVTTSGITLWKIGITNRTVRERFPLEDLDIIDIVWTKEFSNGNECYNEERRILREYKEFQYKGSKVLTSGNTELFTIDILSKSKY